MEPHSDFTEDKTEKTRKADRVEQHFSESAATLEK
jgi:hypothetical protein